VFVYAKTIVAGRRRGTLEVYSSGRYLTVTGNNLTWLPDVINDAQIAIDEMWAQYLAEKPRATPLRRSGVALAEDDCAILERARTAANGTAFRDLYDRGDLTRYADDHSRADLALIGMLAFWFGADAARIDRAFRGSTLYRAKWDERRGAQTYGERTIEEALQSSRASFGESVPRKGSRFTLRPPKC
jgi:putative DNA primase/helicase